MCRKPHYQRLQHQHKTEEERKLQPSENVRWSTACCVQTCDTVRPVHSVLTGLSRMDRVQELQYQHMCRRDVVPHSQAAALQDTPPKATIPPQTSPPSNDTTATSPQEPETHKFFEHITSILPIPLHYQLTKTFSMHQGRSSTRNQRA